MTTGTQTQGPRFMSGTRKYGKYGNFERFDHLSSTHASLGSKTIGKINIDCQLLFKSSQWGVLGEDQCPAGIIYVNLNFGPPQGCRVKTATITITLDEEATCLPSMRSGREFHVSGHPVQITHFGPSGLAGQSKIADNYRTTKLTPELNVLGSGGGGVGFDYTKTFKQSARWSFNGQLRRIPGKNGRVYRSLCFDLSENELETQSFHSSKVRTAFAFEHSGQPFLLKVDIDGKLEKWNHRMKSKLKFATSKEKYGEVVTLIDFEDYARFKQSLDRVAEGLPRAMEMQNLQEIPVEVPDTIPGTFFQPVQASPQNPAPSSSTPLQNQAHSGNPTSLMNGNPLLIQHAATPADNENAHTPREFLRAITELDSPDAYKIVPEDRPSSSLNQILVGSERDEPGIETMEVRKSQESETDSGPTNKVEVDEEAIARMLELPVIIMVLRLLASVMSLWGKGRRQKLK